MKTLGIVVTDIPSDYWLASRYVDDKESAVEFRVRYIDIDELRESDACSVNSYHSISLGDYNRGVRPIVTLSAGSLNNRTGDGTRTNPIVID